MFAISDDTAGMIVAGVSIPLFLLLLVGLGFVIRDTVRGRGRWGINMKATACKKCGEPAPLVRAPKSLNQALWGGWTCAECGFELDKWGEPVPNQDEPAKWKVLDAVEKERRERRARKRDSAGTARKRDERLKGDSDE
jgi:hypothetical protein